MCIDTEYILEKILWHMRNRKASIHRIHFQDPSWAESRAPTIAQSKALHLPDLQEPGRKGWVVLVYNVFLGEKDGKKLKRCEKTKSYQKIQKIWKNVKTDNLMMWLTGENVIPWGLRDEVGHLIPRFFPFWTTWNHLFKASVILFLCCRCGCC